MPTRRPTALLLCVACFVLTACGGGGDGHNNNGNENFSFSDIVGSWLGPTGTATVGGAFAQAAGPTGIDVDAAGNAVGTGASNRQGTLSLTSAARGIYKFTGTGTSAGFTAMLIMSADKNHLLWVGDFLSFGAWQRNATNFDPPYTDAQLRGATWTGTACEMGGSFNPIDPETISVMVDAAGNFTSGTSSTNAVPLAIADANKGHYLGDFADPGPPLEAGALIVVMTPDKNFVAVWSCLGGGTFPDDCSFTALSR